MLSQVFAQIEQQLSDVNTELHLKARLQVLYHLQSLQVNRLNQLLDLSTSQIAQDLFVLSLLNFKTNGYFVEFGASNGISNSNTVLLEKYFGWTGILSEPARCHHQQLFKNRSCHISTDCVYTTSGLTVNFREAAGDGELSGIDGTVDHNGTVYPVTTISLNDLLHQFQAPVQIDYLSIDTEGSELSILEKFNFDKYQVKIISCEHNWTDNREKIYNLLTSRGYERRMENVISYAGYPAGCFDDWYVLKDNQ